MPISIHQLAPQINPQKTVLFFGAGSSVPSGAPSVETLSNNLTKRFNLPASGFSLSELASLAENKSHSRKAMIAELRKAFEKISPTGGLLNVPLYNWKSIFTTNYDTLVEDAYERRGVSVTPFSSDFDFTLHDDPAAAKIFKLHGTIDKDISDGHTSRIIITVGDYDHTKDYRERLFDRLKSDMAGAHVLIIGHSLTDQNIRDEIERAVSLNAQAAGSGRITLLLFNQDHDRASLYEQRGLEICFGTIDEFFSELAKASAAPSLKVRSDNPLENIPSLIPATICVQHAFDTKNADVSKMFNGWPARYAEIVAGLTFQRSLHSEITDHLNAGNGVLCAVIVGASGVGKTTAARQIMLQALSAGILCWEHSGDQMLSVDHWVQMMEELRRTKAEGFLFIDDAHIHLQQINDLIDRAAIADNAHLKLLLASNRNHCNPRIKTPNLYKYGKEWVLSKLGNEEIERLLNLVEANNQIRSLVEPVFSGFSRNERRRRLVHRCEKDFFVCLRNIFATESLDDIILREFAELTVPLQDVYRYVSAMENAGIRVHRQLVLRILGISGGVVDSLLDNMIDVIHEEDVNVRDGIYEWRTRHAVIAGIISKFKFPDLNRIIDLFDKVIDSFNPTYDIEIRSMRDLCNVSTGLPRIPDREIQNRLLRKMMSIAPGERVPRHHDCLLNSG